MITPSRLLNYLKLVDVEVKLRPTGGAIKRAVGYTGMGFTVPKRLVWVISERHEELELAQQRRRRKPSERRAEPGDS